MKNKNLLKDAMADADAIKKLAVENAKASLNEAFDSKIKSILAAKLQEEAEEEDEDEDEAAISKKKKAKMHKEPDADNMGGKSDHDADNKEDEDEDESFDIDAILAEMEGEEDEDEDEDEDEAKKSEEEEEEEEEEEDGEEDSEDEAKKAEEDEEDEEEEEEDSEDEAYSEEEDEDEEVNWYNKKGKKVKETSKEEDEDEDEGVDEEINIDALLAEMKEEDEEDEDEEVNWFQKNPAGGKRKMKEGEEEDEEEDEAVVDPNAIAGAIGAGGAGAAILIGFIRDTLKNMKAKGVTSIDQAIQKAEKEEDPWFKSLLKKVSSAMKRTASAAKDMRTQADVDETKVQELSEQMQKLVKKVNETNLINAKLLYLNKILHKHNLSEGQKLKVIAAFDKAASVKEAKIVYESLNGAIGVKNDKTKTNLKESMGFASKAVGGSTKRGDIITEADQQVARWQKLAGIKVKK
jgi:hypothetical protein